MISYIKQKLKKKRQKHTFAEYGFHLNKFDIDGMGQVEYAQWEHPSETKKIIDKDNIDFFGQFINKGDFAIDIGAHTGDTTVAMALAAGSQGLVLGLEPNPYVFKILKKNAKLNKNLTHIQPECFAATEEDGTFTFNYSDASYCNGGFLSEIESNNHKHNYTLDVKGKDLEKFLRTNYSDHLPKLALLKVDAEGYDKVILSQIEGVIKEQRPYILAECYKRLNKEERNDLFDILAANGYTVYRFEDFKASVQPRKIDVSDMMNWKHFEMLAVPDEKEQFTQS